MSLSEADWLHRLVRPFWAIVAASVLTSLPLASLLVLGSSDLDGTPAEVVFFTLTFTVLATLPAALILGLPIYLAIRDRVRLTPLICGLAGAAIALIAFAAWSMALSPTPIGAKNLAFAQFSGGTALALLSGAAGGLVFWWIVRKSDARLGGQRRSG